MPAGLRRSRTPRALSAHPRRRAPARTTGRYLRAPERRLSADAPRARGLPDVEGRTIDFVPHDERRGGLRPQAQFWFLSNFHFFVIAIGFVGPSLGLAFGWTVLAGAIGLLFGTACQALHGAQGPELGLPQMIQSRAQFGFRGVIVPLLANMVSLVGYNIVASILIAQGVEGMWGVSGSIAAVAAGLAAFAFGVWGHDAVHALFRVMFWAGLPLVAALSLAILAGRAGPAFHVAAGGFNWPAFATEVASAASFNITAAPYVSDYTRYLPRRIHRRGVILTVFLGSGLSAMWMIALGAWLASHTGLSDGLVALRTVGDHIAPGFGSALAAVSIGGLLATMAMTAYSSMLTVFTTTDCLVRIRPGLTARVLVTAALGCAWLWAALHFGGRAITWVNALLVIILYGLAPWTAVNLADYFLVRRGVYSLPDLFTPEGRYGRWNLRGLSAYGAGFLASLPFFVAPGVYAAPVSRRWLGGVDIGWLVSLLVSGLVYLALSGTAAAKGERAAEIVRPDPPV